MEMKILMFYSFIMFFLSCEGQSLKKTDLAKRGLHGHVKILITPTEEDCNWDVNYDSINFNKQGYIVSNYSHSEIYNQNGTKRLIYKIATYCYDAQNDLQKIIYYNTLSHKVFQIDSCEYDNKKNVTSIYTIKPYQEIIKDTLIYSPKGNLIETGTIINNQPNHNKFVYKYNESGNLIEMCWFLGNDYLFVKKNYYYYYDNSRNLQKRIDYNGSYHTENYSYEFDAKKNWIKKIVIFSKTIKRRIYYY